MAKKKNRNRKKGDKSLSIPYPGPLPSVLIMATIVSLGYLWVGGRCESLGKEIGELEIERKHLSEQLNLERARWARNETMDGIVRALARWDIKMSLPPPDRVVVVMRRDLLDEQSPKAGQDRYAMVPYRGYEQL